MYPESLVTIRSGLISLSVVTLVNDKQQFGTLELSSADVALLLRGGTMRLNTTLGNLSFLDETPTATYDKAFKNLLAIEGEELADFSYETFDAQDKETFPGYNAAVKLRAGSLQFTVMQEPLQHLMSFLSNLSRLKAVYDRASSAAMERAPEVSRMHYDVVVKTPIIVIPKNGYTSAERVVLRLGEVSATNKFGDGGESPDTIKAGLTGVNITTEGGDGVLPILDKVSLSFDIEQHAAREGNVTRQKVCARCSTQTAAKIAYVLSA